MPLPRYLENVQEQTRTNRNSHFWVKIAVFRLEHSQGHFVLRRVQFEHIQEQTRKVTFGSNLQFSALSTVRAILCSRKNNSRTKQNNAEHCRTPLIGVKSASLLYSFKYACTNTLQEQTYGVYKALATGSFPGCPGALGHGSVTASRRAF